MHELFDNYVIPEDRNAYWNSSLSIFNILWCYCKGTWRKKTPAMQDIWRTDTYPPLGILPLALDQYYVSFHEGELVVIIGFTVI